MKRLLFSIILPCEILSQEAAAQCRMPNKFRLNMENDIAVMGFFILGGKGDGWISYT